MDDRRRDGGTNSTLRTKEQGMHITLNEHDDDDVHNNNNNNNNNKHLEDLCLALRMTYTFIFGSSQNVQ